MGSASSQVLIFEAVEQLSSCHEEATPDQTHHSAMRFFLMARAHYARFGFSIRRVLTDNGSCYKHWLFRKLLHRQHIKHRFTRPYTPRTNGKAERFIQTALREWAYARSYQNSNERQGLSTPGCMATTSTAHTQALNSTHPLPAPA
jgi:transposase InsO family protein